MVKENHLFIARYIDRTFPYRKLRPIIMKGDVIIFEYKVDTHYSDRTAYKKIKKLFKNKGY